MNLHREYPDDELIVNYHDACIYGRDLKLLKSPTAWLNDACIHFHLTRLQQNRVGDLFLDPSVVSYFVHQCSDKDDLLDFARGYNNFQGLKRVFFPVNDNLASSNWQTPGMGQHWSLMVIFLLNNRQVKYLHFDSVPGSNSRAAIELARRWSGLWKYLVCTDPKREGLSSTKAPNHIETSVDVLECQAPKQRNGFDCGIHVLFTAESLALDELQDNDQVEAYEQVLEGKFGNRFECDPLFGVALRRRIAEDIIRVAQEANKKA